MRKYTKKLKTFEQFGPDPEVQVPSVDTETLHKLIDEVKPKLNLITNIIENEEDRTISIEYANKLSVAIMTLDELKRMY